MSRKLASIQKIIKLEPIPNADSIEKATILGWQCVVKKGDFEVDSLCAYCEIDSILPDKPEFDFLRPRKFRIKTIRLRGQVSQGIAFPLNILPTIPHGYKEGDDVTELLEITQWQPKMPECLKGLVKGPFPRFMPKTDETRVNILQGVLDRYKGVKCYVTEKVDGTSVTYYLNKCLNCVNGLVEDSQCPNCKGTGKVFGVCSRNLELKETEGNLYWKMARELEIEEKLRTLNKNIAIQGEIIGNGISGNKLKIIGNKVLFFNVFDIDRYIYLSFKEFKEMIYFTLGLEGVPVLDTDYALENDIPTLVKKAIGKSIINPKAWREGIVIRPEQELIDMEMASGFGNGRVSFKCVNVEYLINDEE